MLTFIRKSPLLSYFLLVFLLAWGVWLPIQFWNLPPVLIWLAGIAPIGAGILVTWLVLCPWHRARTSRRGWRSVRSVDGLNVVHYSFVNKEKGMKTQTASIKQNKLYIVFEVIFIYALIQTLIVLSRSIDLVQREKQALGWSYTVPLICFVILPAVVIWLTRRNWEEYGVSLKDWRTNLDIGIKAFVVLIIPHGIGRSGAYFLGLNPPTRDIVIDITWVIAIAVMIWVMNRHKPVASGRNNLILIAVLLLLPILIALWVNKLSVVVVSTIVWQFVLSGFGEEFAFRGYFQSRLNQAFGRPMRLLGVQFGAGLIVASLLFGVLHIFNGFDPAIGFASLGWDVFIGNTLAGFFLGIIREKTGTLLAPSIAHGLPDALGEPMMKIFGWVMY